MEQQPNFAELLERGFSEQAVILSSDLKIICANAAFEEASGLSAAELKGKHCYQILKGCQESCVASKRECPIHEIIATNVPVSMTHQDILVNGERRHFMINIQPIRPGYNESLSFLHITRDITNRIEEERFKERMWTEILGRMEQIYTSMVQNSRAIDAAYQKIDYLTDAIPLALVGWDGQGKVTQWNSSAEILFGWRTQEILGEPFIDIFSSGKSQENFRKIFLDMIRGRTLAYSLSENRTVTGRIIDCEWHHSALFEKKGGKVAGGLSVAQDVTERFVTQKTLSDTQAELSALLKNTEEAIIAVNHFGRIIVCNDAAESLFGWQKHELLGRQIEKFIPSELLAQHSDTIDAYFQHVQQKDIGDQCFEISAKHKDGSSIPVRIKLALTSLEGKPAVIGVILDISSQRRMEKILAETDKVRELGELAMGMAHDFNNILSVVKGNLQLIKEMSPQNSAFLQKAEAIEKAIADGSRKAADIHLMAFADSIPGRLRCELTDVNKLILGAVNFSQYRWKDQAQRDGHSIALSTDLEELPLIPLDPGIFQDALVNIIFNAIDALPSGGNIHIQSKMEKDRLVVQVEDNGDGISKENMARIFNPFFTTKKSGHSGLGLSSVRKNISSLGGTVRAESSLGIGTTLILELPVPLLAQKSAEGADAPLAGPPRKILIVDDNVPLAHIIENCCQNAGHTVFWAANGKDAIKLLREQHVDVLITDLGMPEMAGDEVALRAKEIAPHLDIIMITGWGEEVDRSELRRIGVAEIVSKPFDLDVLLGKIAQLPVNR